MQTRYAEGSHPCRPGRADPAGGILDDETVAGGDAQFLGCGQEDRGVGFAVWEVASGDVGVEQLLQRHPGADEVVLQLLFGGESVQPDPLQEAIGVLGRGGCRDPDAHVLDRQDEPDGIGESHEPAFLDQRDHVRLLVGRVLLDPCVDVGHAEVLHGRACTSHPWHPGDELLVNRGREGLGCPARLVADVAPVALHQRPEHVAPGQLVR